ncbi:MAG TPA: methylmalonyl-CoA epimerase [Anaerolineaceae bacterium]|nr:methylmalonyl-CoA epimerase [Anaerolineaceae bacterium]HPX66267.1 methylmalonyl-CoA epimerase [Anaerolineaceae bacterium]
MTIKKINHVAIAVKDIEAALDFWENKLGLKLDYIEEVPSEASRVAFIPIGDSLIELVQPTRDDTGMAAYLEKRGEGMHHLCVEVENIDETFNRLKEQGVRLINTEPQVLPGRKMAFIHPKAANGVLVELYELTDTK